MTNEQINIAIAEACGWRIAERVSPEAKEDATACWIRPNGDEWQEESLPDYCNDLNAMHEAEKVLNDEQWPEYREELRNVVLGGIRMVSQWCKADLHATARQRAEAFLKTIGKWEE
jgi:hypothetical protein